MKKIAAFLCSIVVIFFVICGFNYYYLSKISNKYYDKVGDILTDDKFKSLALQKDGIKRGDNLFLFGSSEFEVSKECSTHPSKFFNNKKAGFQANLIGKAGYQCLVHAVDFGALGNALKSQKVVFVLSPQWFSKNGIAENTFLANSSEEAVYSFLFNKNLDSNLKTTLAKRIVTITNKPPVENPKNKKKSKNANDYKDFYNIKNYCSLYIQKDIPHRLMFYAVTPYYWMRYQLLLVKNEIKSEKVLKPTADNLKIQAPQNVTFNWNKELSNAQKKAQTFYHNSFNVDDTFYKNATKKGLTKLKNNSYKISPEYDDFKLLLDICKEEGIKPLIVNVPVNGKWYDYCGFNKNDREAYYKKINSLVKSYGFQVADFSNHEYTDYFLKDASHLGWKGWVYVDKAIDEYYRQN